jgi:hypothetical protein
MFLQKEKNDSQRKKRIDRKRNKREKGKARDRKVCAFAGKKMLGIVERRDRWFRRQRYGGEAK